MCKLRLYNVIVEQLACLKALISFDSPAWQASQVQVSAAAVTRMSALHSMRISSFTRQAAQPHMLPQPAFQNPHNYVRVLQQPPTIRPLTRQRAVACCCQHKFLLYTKPDCPLCDGLKVREEL